MVIPHQTHRSLSRLPHSAGGPWGPAVELVSLVVVILWEYDGNMMGRWWEYDGNMGISHHLYPFLPFVSSCLHLAAAWRWFSATTATRGSSYVKSSAMWGWLTHRPSLQRYIHNNPHNIAIDRLQESSPNGMFSWIYHICISFTS